MLREIESIREYTAQHGALTQCHHFLFDLHLQPGAQSADYVVLGINPGEQSGDWEAWPTNTEESSAFDFREQLGTRPRASVNWRKLAKEMCGTDKVVMSELFVWSTKDIGASFRQRFGHEFHKSPHLQFSIQMNKRLIDNYKPKAVVVPGLTTVGVFGKHFHLNKIGEVRTQDGLRLIEHYEVDGISWVFTKHWSGSFGFSTAQRQTIARYIAEI